MGKKRCLFNIHSNNTTITTTTGRSSILLNKIFLVTESSLLGTLRAVYPRRRHLYSDGLRTTEYTAFCFF